MSTFRFRLQNVLDLRERQERELASQLAKALSTREEAIQQRDSLQATRDASASQTFGLDQPRSVGELANLAFMLERLDGHIASANEAAQTAAEHVEHAQEGFTAAFQDRRVLDRLRNRHEEMFKTSAEQQDRRAMDEIAITRYTQPDNQ